jgi:hypothetical protein
MTKLKIEDVRFSSSSIDDFFLEHPVPVSRSASSGKIRISSLQQLAGYRRIANDKLVHMSQQDFWKLGQDDDGHYIERLVSDDDGPVVG